MYNVHLIIDNKLARYWHPEHLPSVGDEIRVGPKLFVRVEQRIFVMDESKDLGQRVNLGCTKIKIK